MHTETQVEIKKTELALMERINQATRRYNQKNRYSVDCGYFQNKTNLTKLRLDLLSYLM